MVTLQCYRAQTIHNGSSHYYLLNLPFHSCSSCVTNHPCPRLSTQPACIHSLLLCTIHRDGWLTPGRFGIINQNQNILLLLDEIMWSQLLQDIKNSSDQVKVPILNNTKYYKIALIIQIVLINKYPDILQKIESWT